MDGQPEQTSNDAPQTPVWKRRCIALLAFVPLLSAAWVNVSDTPLPRLAYQGPERPPLVFEPWFVEFTEEELKQSVIKTPFYCLNRGDEPVTFGQIERSCGCLAPRLHAQTIQPGKVGAIYVDIETLRQAPGEHQYILDVAYSDSKKWKAQLLIKATFPQKMVVTEPKELFISQRTEQDVPFQVSISDYRDKPLSVTGLESSAWFVTGNYIEKQPVPIVPASESEDDVELVRTITQVDGKIAGPVPPGRHYVILNAKTNDHDFPAVTVPVFVTGPNYVTEPEPTVQPAVARLAAASHKEARQARVTIKVPADWDISHASAWPQELTVRYGQSEPETDAKSGDRLRAIRLDIRMPRLPQKGVTRGVVQLVANEGQRMVTVPVTILWP